MSQKIPSDSGQKGFAVGRGLLAAAETLNYSMGEQRSDGLQGSSRQLNSMVSGMGGVGDGQDRNSQLSQRGGASSHIGNTMKLFASLGLSPTDLDALAQIPEENISVETLPHLIMQLKNRKGDSNRHMVGNPRDLPSISSEDSYRTTRDNWDDMRSGRLGTSMGQSSARGQQGDLSYGPMQNVTGARGYELDYNSSNNNSVGGGGGRERQYSELSHDHYGGLGMGPPASNSVFMQRRMGSPSQGKVQDYLGVMPHMFPHVCSLCDFDVHSIMEWNQHSNGLRHAENQRLLLQIYPDWNPPMAQSRSSESHVLDTSNLSRGLLGAAPMTTGQQNRGMPSSWGGVTGHGHGKAQAYSAQPKIRSRVVVAKYDRKLPPQKKLFALTEPFGTLCEHLVLKTKAFLEMQTHKEALAMVNYYKRKPANIFGQEITFYLSKELMVIEKDERTNRPSQVVFFSNLPWEAEKKMELLTIAKRFGTVEKHLFLKEEAFVQLGTPEDAQMLVKYYTLNPLTIKGRVIRLNMCTKYRTLNVKSSKSGQGWSGEERGRKSSTSSTGTKTYSKGSSVSAAEDKEEEPNMAGGDGSGDEVVGVVEGDEAEGEDAGTQQVDKDDGAELPGDGAEADAEPSEAVDCASEPRDEEPELKDENVPSNGRDQEEPDGEQGDGSEERSDSQVERTTPGEAEGSSHEKEAKGDAEATEPVESSDLADDGQSEGPEGSMEQDFPENMDDFVTLDELADEDDMDSQSKGDSSAGSTRKNKEMRVVNVVGFKRGHTLVSELLALAKPFGKVDQHLVLDLRPEAFIQLSSEEEARAMVQFYNGNVTPTVCGKAVRIYHSQTYPTIQCGNSRVVYVGGIPNSKYLDVSILKIAEPFGKIRRFFLNRIRSECFIEMERGEDAEKMAETYRENPPRFQNKRLTVYISRKYKQLKYGHRPPGAASEEKRPIKRDREEGDVSTSSSPAKPTAKQQQEEEEPAVKKFKEEKSPVVKQEPEKDGEETSAVSSKEQNAAAAVKEVKNTDQPSESSEVQKTPTDSSIKREEEPAIPISEKNEENGQTPSSQTPAAETKPANASLPLEPYDPTNPIGVEFVKMGYYCRVCFLFYSNEDTAKKVHCSSQAHYEKLKKHLEKEKTKASSTTGKKVAQ
ncbi:matrin 3-like 1.2 isoform X2 [Osmerus eperlanus]|uniref:matrin 3-like 1.2 isoform X2 n=1 Tax=Osmerus eperlanus TaxID=29151 RepID=UPI002E0E05A4